MRVRIVWQLATLAVFTLVGGITLSWTLGQPPAPVRPSVDRPPPAVLPASVTGVPLEGAVTPAVAASTPPGPLANLDQLSPIARQFTLASERGTEWMCRMNQPSGRFQPGWVAALYTPLEHDHYLIQAQSAWALARAARYTNDEQHIVRAGQAILSLLAETTVEGDVRRTSQPSLAANRLGAAALLVLATHELPALEPAKDKENKPFLDQAEQLCQYLRQRQRPDGSLATGDDLTEADAEANVARYTGLALYALAVSQRQRPAGWKTEVLSKALPYCQKWWKEHASADFACTTATAYAESYRVTKDAASGEFVLTMCDWLCSKQLDQLDPRHPRWYGGFQTGTGAPTVDSAQCVWAIVEGCRVTRQVPDAARYERYKSVATRGLQFLTTLQYADDNTQHFTTAARPAVAGGFHVSHQDGTLRTEATGWTLVAMVPYLMELAK